MGGGWLAEVPPVGMASLLPEGQSHWEAAQVRSTIFAKILSNVCAQSLCHLTLCDLMDCSSSIHGILQARILQWVVFSFSRGSSWPRD